jgi:hypothetical protein
VSFPLYCDRCHGSLGRATDALQLVGIFKPSAAVQIPKSHPQEDRLKCRGCGFVSIYRPLLREDVA